MSTHRPNRRNAWLAFLIIGLPLLWTLPTFYYLRAQTARHNSGCVQNLKMIYGALHIYAADHHGALPAGANWKAAILPYLEDATLLRCPADGDKTHPVSYAMNANLSGKKLQDIKNPHDVILLYETTSKASTPCGRGEDLVRIGKENVGVGRHNTIAYRFNYYLMADGTVRAPQDLPEVRSYQWTP